MIVTCLDSLIDSGLGPESEEGYPFHPLCSLWGNEMKQRISQSVIHKYAKSRIGYSSGHEISPYHTATKALEIDGKPQPSGVAYKKWVTQNYEFIAAEVAKLPKKLAPKKGPKKAAAPTESSVKAFVSKSAIDPCSEGFLESFEWRSTRMIALKKYGPVCQCCGASPATGAVMHVDHIKPRKFFPHLALDVENLQVLCGECNHGKGNWDTTDWRDRKSL